MSSTEPRLIHDTLGHNPMHRNAAASGEPRECTLDASQCNAGFSGARYRSWSNHAGRRLEVCTNAAAICREDQCSAVRHGSRCGGDWTGFAKQSCDRRCRAIARQYNTPHHRNKLDWQLSVTAPGVKCVTPRASPWRAGAVHHNKRSEPAVGGRRGAAGTRHSGRHNSV
jgi:hypothetical protein